MRSLFFIVSACLTLNPATLRGVDDWLQWRGPNRNGIAGENEKPPVDWSENRNVVWKAKVPGRGHSSPVIHNGRIYLTTADQQRQTQSVVCYRLDSGKPVWKMDLHTGNLVSRIHKKNTHASPTIACDQKNLFVCFNNDDAVFLTKMGLNGDVVWQKKLGGYDPRYPFGFAPSPTIYRSTVIVSAESKVGFLVALDRETGDPVWRIDRKKSSFSSPIIAEIGGQPYLLLSGGSAVAAFDPANGRKLWETPAIWQVSCGTLVWSDEFVFASGGFPRAQTLCIRADGTGKVVWQNNVKCYEQSMLYHDGFLYAVSDQGIGYCWYAKTGEEMWKARMEGPVSCSPIMADGKIYYSSERGTTFVYKAQPRKFELLSKNKLGQSAFATPAFVNNRIITRVAFDEDGRRQEYLYCLGK